MSDTTPADSEQSENKPVQDSQEPAKAKKIAKKAAKKTAKKTAKKAAKKTAKKAAKKVAKKVAKATPEITGNETSTEISKSKDPAPIKSQEVTETLQKDLPQPKQEDQQTKSSDQQPSDNQEQNKQHRGRVPGKGKVQHNNQNKQGKQNNQNKNQRGNKNNGNKNNRNKQNKNNNNRRHKNQKEKKVELTGPPVAVNGMLELAPKGFGFLRTLDKGLEQASDDVFVTPDLIRTHGLRLGVWIHGEAMQGPRGLQLTKIETINGRTTDEARGDRFSTRVLDIIAPVGRGQRGLIVSPPRSGKTTLMMHMAEAIQEKYDEQMHLIILLVDERPEEVTEFKHSLPDAEIFASSNDSGPKNHCLC